MIYLTDENFYSTIKKSEKPILVDFFALWCGPCQMFAPIFEKLAEEFKDKVVFAKVDTDACPQISSEMGIQNLPTILYFENGKAIAGFIGAKDEEETRQWLEKVLAEKETREFNELKEEMEKYAEKHGVKLNQNEKIVESIIKGLLANEKNRGFRFCPCRRIDGDFKKDWRKICPCAWHWDEIDKDGRCHCGLFVRD